MCHDLAQLRTLLAKHRQEHLLAFWDVLTDDQRDELSATIARIDFDEITKLFDHEASHTDWSEIAGRATGPNAVRIHESGHAQTVADAKKRGSEALASGEVGVLLVAGGQGTRLGFDHSKGMYPIAPDSGRTLFQILIAKLLDRADQHGAAIPLYLMTSPTTHEETVEFLEKHERFGLPSEDLNVFCQGTMPAVDSRTGKILLAEKGRLALSPDGHGGVVDALLRNSLLTDMARRGVRRLFYMQVDNPLVEVADPRFLGHHLLSGSQMSTQVVRKVEATEKVGNVVAVEGRLRIIEYSDLPADVACRRDRSGELALWAGNIAVHVIDVALLREVADHIETLPWHLALKQVPYVDATGHLVSPSEPNATKFERFVFDLMPHAEDALAFEVERSTAFAPLKTSDDVQRVRRQLREHQPKWL